MQKENNMRTKERYKTKSAVFVMFIYDDKVLCQKRQNTGFMDGFYDMGASGHVEEEETLTQAAKREVKEELNIDIDKERLKLVTTIHHKSEDEVYYYFYFSYILHAQDEYDFSINEPEKNEKLIWLNMSQLPEDVTVYNRQAVDNYYRHIPLSELGF
ncbi:NUDIX domain-containing protein [Granulicatella sp. zg-ZJ]|nr:NUDIX domain-containing protein [Granulicatella sp. zg-ZJ]